jgi:hypothetical protein
MIGSLQTVAIRVNTHCSGFPATFCGVSTAAERLKIARARRFRSPRAAAIENGWAESTVRSHEYGLENADKGGRGLDEEWARKYGAAYGVSWKWLLFNESQPAGPQPREIDVAEETPADQVAVIVRTGGRARYFTSGYMYFTEERRSPDDMIGRECVVRLPDGSTVVGMIRRGAKRRTYTIEGPSGSVLENQRIEWAEPVGGRL